MNIKPSSLTFSAATLNAQMYITTCFEKAEIKYKIKAKANERIGRRAFDIDTVHVSYFKIKNKYKKKALAALNSMPEAQKQFLLKNEQGFEALITKSSDIN